MRCDIITLCKSAYEDDKGELSIERSFCRIGFRKLPTRWAIHFVARVQMTAEEEGRHWASMTITDPDGLDVVSFAKTQVISRMLPDESFGHIVFMAPCEWVVTTFGEYLIRLRIDDHEYFTELHVRRYRKDAGIGDR